MDMIAVRASIKKISSDIAKQKVLDAAHKLCQTVDDVMYEYFGDDDSIIGVGNIANGPGYEIVVIVPKEDVQVYDAFLKERFANTSIPMRATFNDLNNKKDDKQ